MPNELEKYFRRFKYRQYKNSNILVRFYIFYLYDLVYDALWYIKKPYYVMKRLLKRIKRQYQWIKNVLWDDHDWNGNTIFSILEYKLTRIRDEGGNQPASLTNRIRGEMDTKSIRICTKLAKRITDEYHDKKLNERHEKKWGGYKSWFTPNPGSSHKTYHSSRSKIESKEQEEIERLEAEDIWIRAQKWKKRDISWLFKVIEKYYDLWYD